MNKRSQVLQLGVKHNPGYMMGLYILMG